MDLPTQVRFPVRSKKKLTATTAKTGIHQADIIRLAVEELFKKYPTNDALFSAYMEAKRTEAAK